MTRSQRLLALLQVLRSHRFAVPGTTLAERLNVSLRTLYRDIQTLREQGAVIEGEPGLGYILRPGFCLPPLMFSAEEIEALVLGSRWVMGRGDTSLAEAARTALDKIRAVLPVNLQVDADTVPLLVGPGATGTPDEQHLLPLLREAMRDQIKVDLDYQDLQERCTTRRIWPVALGYFDQVRVLLGWCELREDFRNFRVDRVRAWHLTGLRYPHSRRALLHDWRQREGIHC